MRCRLSLLVLPVLILGGCNSGPAPPRTYPVKGRVVAEDGSSVAGGHVWFSCTADSNLSALGDIDPEGAFALRTVFGNHACPEPSREPTR